MDGGGGGEERAGLRYIHRERAIRKSERRGRIIGQLARGARSHSTSNYVITSELTKGGEVRVICWANLRATRWKPFRWLTGVGPAARPFGQPAEDLKLARLANDH